MVMRTRKSTLKDGRALDDPMAAAEGALEPELRGIDLGKLRESARKDEQASETRRVSV